MQMRVKEVLTKVRSQAKIVCFRQFVKVAGENGCWQTERSMWTDNVSLCEEKQVPLLTFHAYRPTIILHAPFTAVIRFWVSPMLDL